MTNIFTIIQMFFFAIDYVFSPKGVHEFNFAYDLSYDFRSNEIFAKRVFHATRFATMWVARAAYEEFIETRVAVAR